LSVEWRRPVDAQDRHDDHWRRSSAVVVVGDDRLFADALSLTLQGAGFDVPRIVDRREDAIGVIEGVGADIVLVDVATSGEGLSLGARIAARRGDATRVVALTQTEDQRLVDRSVRLGFSGYLTKDLPTAEFVRSLETIADGHLVVPRRHSDEGRHDDGPLAALTGREREVLTLLVRGATSADIARELDVSDHTIRTHMQNLFGKLGVRSRVQAAAIAVKLGIR
jgi:DNA-binding NarL/FixJ family response regulator